MRLSDVQACDRTRASSGDGRVVAERREREEGWRWEGLQLTGSWEKSARQRTDAGWGCGRRQRWEHQVVWRWAVGGENCKNTKVPMGGRDGNITKISDAHGDATGASNGAEMAQRA